MVTIQYRTVELSSLGSPGPSELAGRYNDAIMRSFAAVLCLALVSACGDRDRSAATPDAPFSLIENIEAAEATFDDTLFRSVRKDGSLVNAVTLDGRTELSLTPPLPSELRYRLRVPATPVLQFATAAATAGDDVLAAPIDLEMRVDVDGASTVVFSDLFRRRATNVWRDHEADLSPWAGRDVELVLKSTWRTEGDIRQPVLVSWGNPVIADENAAADEPLLVLISVDCLRADHVGAYGYERATTPAIDALARDGTVFENAFATASWTLPTHMSMLTGLVPSLHGATKWEKLASSVAFLPETLAEAGYRTSGVVSWVYLSQTFGFERGYHAYRVLDDPEAPDIVDAAITELRRGRGQPQFLFVHLYDPHWPYLPPSERIETFGERPRDISTLLKKTGGKTAPDDDTEIDEIIRLYDAEIAFADEELGRLFDAMRTSDVYDDALIVVTSDHGEAFWDHGHWQHTLTLFDELTHVPLIIKWPQGANAGRVDDLVSQVDLFPTLAEAAGVAFPESERGVMARRSLAAASASPRTLLSEVTWRSPDGTFMKVSLRDRNLKYIATLSGPVGDDLAVSEVTMEELYDLAADPEERHNLLPGDASRASRYRAELRAFLDDAKAARSLRAGEAVELDDRTLEKLESLGYTHDR